MIEFFVRLFDADGFMPRSRCGQWTPELMWLHIGSDIMIWLAYLSIPIVLVYFVTRRRGIPFPKLFWLFGAFILACGFTHFIDSMMFQTPVYRLLGLMKVITAVISWVTVLALISAVPTALAWIEGIPGLPADNPEPLEEAKRREYIIAILAACLAILVRYSLNGFFGQSHPFHILLLAVIFTAWHGGFGPTVVTTVITTLGAIYLFLSPHDTFRVDNFNDQLGVGIYFFGSVATGLLGESQLFARKRADAALQSALGWTLALNEEVGRRRIAEADVRQANDDLAAAQKQTADALTLLNSFVMNAPIGLAFLDRGLHYVRINEFLAAAASQPVEAYLGHTVEEIQPLQLNAANALTEVLTTGQPILGRLITGRPTNREGETFWQTNYFPVRDPQGEMIGVGIATQEITQRIEAEQRLSESETRFRMLTEALPQLVWVTRPDGYHEFYNVRWYEYTGLTVNESIGYGWQFPLHPDDTARAAARWQLSLDTGEPYEIEYRFRRADGCYRWFLGRALPQRDANGVTQRWIGTCTDIDDYKRLTEELRRSSERFRLLTESLPQMVWTTDPTGRITYFNRRWEDFVGITVEEAEAEGWLLGLHPDDVNAVSQSWRSAVAGKSDSYVREFRIRNRVDGSYRWFLCTAVPLTDANGTIVQWVGGLTDIDAQRRQAETLEGMVRERTHELSDAVDELKRENLERRRLEERERAISEELRRSNEELQKFAYVASHDLQEPLRKIQAFGDRLTKRYYDVLTGDGQGYVDRMIAASSRMRTLIDDLLSFSRVTTKPHAVQQTDLNDVARGVLSDLEIAVAQSGGRVDVGELPTIQADASQMRQVFQNLIGNALKFARPGVPPVVRIVSETFYSPTGRRLLRITCSDNGIGFDESYRDRIFEVFQRLHARDEYAGTGIGLAIVKKIVERHGGTITATGRTGEGSTFTIELPDDEELG